MRQAKKKAVQFQIESEEDSYESQESSAGEDDDGSIFRMRDISDEVKRYQKYERSQFQRLNMVLIDLGNVQLQKYFKN